jgi:hypothetical protein
VSVTPGIVTFNPAVFIEGYPAFRHVTAAALQNNFNSACLLLNNSYSSIVCDAPTRAQILNLITAHITALLNGVNGEPPSGIVGRINSATQGSVSVQAEFKTDSEAASFFAQTQWGLLAWRQLAIYRTVRYVTAQRCGTESWEAWPQ